MESLGGVEFSKNNNEAVLNIARLYRDLNVAAIWQNTTGVMTDDKIRLLKGKTSAQALRVLESWIEPHLQHEGRRYCKFGVALDARSKSRVQHSYNGGAEIRGTL